MEMLENRPLMDALVLVAKNQNVTVTVKESAKAGMIAGTSCFIGAVCGGPFGLALGGLVGTSIAYMRSGNLKPLWKVLAEDLSDTEKATLTRNIQLAFQDFNAQDVILLASLLLQNTNMQEKAMKVAINYVTQQCRSHPEKLLSKLDL